MAKAQLDGLGHGGAGERHGEDKCQHPDLHHIPSPVTIMQLLSLPPEQKHHRVSPYFADGKERRGDFGFIEWFHLRNCANNGEV
jgi:hypothetical protein